MFTEALTLETQKQHDSLFSQDTGGDYTAIRGRENETEIYTGRDEREE